MRPTDPLIDRLAAELGVERKKAGKLGLRRLVCMLLGKHRGRPRLPVAVLPEPKIVERVDVERMVELAFRRRA